MTSTSFNVGLAGNTRMSSRVLRPPGGGHTDIFGGDPEPPRGRRHVPSAVVPSQEPAKPMNGSVEPCQNGQAAEPQHEQPAQPEPAEQSEPPQPEPKSESTTKPEPKPQSPTKPEPPQEQPKVEPPRRVRVPPGGFSSGLW